MAYLFLLYRKRRRFLSVIIACLVFSTRPVFTMPLSENEIAITGYIDAHFDESVRFLEKIVNINSGTMNHDGVKAVAKIFEPEFRNLGFTTRWVDLPAEVNRAGHLFAETNGSQGKRLLKYNSGIAIRPCLPQQATASCSLYMIR
jgi:glutamate carboxypeptidase